MSKSSPRPLKAINTGKSVTFKNGATFKVIKTPNPYPKQPGTKYA